MRTILFIVGCPRSGTTWVQALLAQHPRVATAPETQIFAYYLDRFRKQWRWEQEGTLGRRHGGAGLSRLLSPEEFDELCRRTARFVLEKIAATNPGARVVVEKSPRHARQAAWIRRLLPDARFLHVVRDPRDVAASLLAAGASWAPWAPRNPTGAADMWLEHVDGAREVRDDAARYRELRYEDIQRDPAAALGALHDWLDLPSDPARRAQAVEACRLARLKEDSSDVPTPAGSSPRGFFRRGVVGGWADELRPWQIRVIERLCGDRMDELGYERTNPARGALVAPTRTALHRLIWRVRGGLHWRLGRLVRRV